MSTPRRPRRIPCTLWVLRPDPPLAVDLDLPAGATLHGWAFVTLPDDPVWGGYAHCLWTITVPWAAPEPPDWPHLQVLSPIDDGAVRTEQVWCSRVQCRDDPILAERLWNPARGLRDRLIWISGPASLTSLQVVQRAWRGFHFLDGTLASAGQKRLEQKVHHPWRATAVRAEELQREHPRWGRVQIARELGMLGREETLRLWRNRLSENG